MSDKSEIDKNRDYPKLSKATSGYLEIPYFENARRVNTDVNDEESGTIAPHGECTLWVPIEEQDNNTKLNW